MIKIKKIKKKLFSRTKTMPNSKAFSGTKVRTEGVMFSVALASQDSQESQCRPHKEYNVNIISYVK